MGNPRDPSTFKPDSNLDGVSPQDVRNNCIESRHIGESEIENKHISDNAIGSEQLADDLELSINHLDFNLESDSPHLEGRLRYDKDDKTLLLNTEVSGTSLQIGQEQYIRATNKTGLEITNGKIVFVDGAQGQRPTVDLARSDLLATSKGTLAISTHSVDNNKTGYFTTFGLVRDLDTDSCSEGDLLYLSSSSAGSFTNVRPDPPNNIIMIGFCLYSHATEGVVLFSINCQIFETLKVGGNLNYSEFKEDGTLKMAGDATTFNDIFFGLSGARVPAANAPSWDSFVGNLNQYAFGLNDYLELSASEILHDYKQGSNLELHVHYATGGLDINDRTVKWELECTIANMNVGSNVDTVFSGTTIISAEEIIPANTPDRTHRYLNIGDIINANLKIGANIAIRIRRIASSGTEPSDDPFGLMVGIHYERDTLGSRTESSK